MQRRVNTAGLRLLSLQKACLQSWPMAGIWELGFWQGPHHPQNWLKWLTAPKLFVQTTWFMPKTCFASGSLEFWYMLGRGCLFDQPPVKTLSTEPLTSFPGRQHFTCCHNLLLEELSASCVTTLGGDSWKLVLSIPQTLSDVPFPFVVIRYGRKHDYMLGPVSIPSKSSNPAVVLGIPDTPNVRDYVE